MGRTLGRRRFVLGLSVLALTACRIDPPTQPKFATNPFTLGVASGDPLPDRVVIWTRLAPDPSRGDGGLDPAPITVHWRVAADDRMQRVVREGEAVADARYAHTVHVDVEGLGPDRPYWYQFDVGSELSPIGRTRTAPRPDASQRLLKIAFASCQNYEQGYYTAHRHLAEEDIAFVAFLGDYIYEYDPARGRPRLHGNPEPTTLDGYRIRYAQYKRDPDLQAAHAAHPWIATMDDHEVENNFAGLVNERETDPVVFARRRAAAYQAYWEHLPFRLAQLPAGPNMQLYRRLSYGDLAEINVVDTRQYRSNQPCQDGVKPPCPEVFSPQATMFGDGQERWLLDGLGRSAARWNLIANQVQIAQLNYGTATNQRFNMDRWDGYQTPRQHLLRFLGEAPVRNLVVLTGDAHYTMFSELKTDFNRPESPSIGVELVTTSISSGGEGVDQAPVLAGSLSVNPHVRYYNNQRGYTLVDITPNELITRTRLVSTVLQPGGAIRTGTTWVVEAGTNRLSEG